VAPVTFAPGGCLGGYRILRRIASGARAQVFLAVPEPAEVPELRDDGAASGARPVVLRVYDETVDQDTVTIELEALTALGGAALPSLIDVFAVSGSVCLVVESISGHRLSNVLDERRLAPGEAVTVLAPLVAAVSELAEAGFAHPEVSAADVRFDASGRPRITGLGRVRRLGPVSADRTGLERRSHEALVELIELVAGATNPATPLHRVVELARTRLVARPFEPFTLALEQELFRVAVASPVRGAADALRAPGAWSAPPVSLGLPALEGERTDPVAESAAAASMRRARAGRAARPAPVGEGRTALGHLLAAEAPLFELFRQGSLRRWLAERLGRRRGVVAVGALAAAAASVLLLTLVPPQRGASADGGAATVERPAAAASSPEKGGVLESTGEPAGADAGVSAGADAAALDDPAALAAAAAELLALRDTCLSTADPRCLAQVVQPGSALERNDQARLSDETPAEAAGYDLDAVTVAGTMGGAVLLRVPVVGVEREPASLLMIRSEAGWRLREIFD